MAWSSHFMSGHFLVIGSVVRGALIMKIIWVLVSYKTKIPVMAVVVVVDVEVVVEIAGDVSFSDIL